MLNTLSFTGVLGQALSLNQNEIPSQEKLLNKFFGKDRRMAEIIPKWRLNDSVPLEVFLESVVVHVHDVVSTSEYFNGEG